MKDFLGNEISIGDTVIIDYVGFYLADVKGITDKSVLVEFTMYDSIKETLEDPKNVIKVNYGEVPVYRKKWFNIIDYFK